MSIDVDVLITGIMLLAPASAGDTEFQRGAMLVAPLGKGIDKEDSWLCDSTKPDDCHPVHDHIGALRFDESVVQILPGSDRDLLKLADPSGARIQGSVKYWDLTGRDVVFETGGPSRVHARLGNMANLSEVHSRADLPSGDSCGNQTSAFNLPDEIRDCELPKWLGMRVWLSGGKLKDNDWAWRQKLEPEHKGSWWRRLWLRPLEMGTFVEGGYDVSAFPDGRPRRGTRGIRWRFRTDQQQLTVKATKRDDEGNLDVRRLHLRPKKGKLEMQILFQTPQQVGGDNHSPAEIIGHAQLLYRLLTMSESTDPPRGTRKLLPRWASPLPGWVSDSHDQPGVRAPSDTACPPFHGGP